MKHKIPLVVALIAVLLAATLASADDGQMFRRNVSDTPDGETEKAAIAMLKFYVPAQAADGTLLEAIEYYNADGGLVETREFAKPLVVGYIDGIEGLDGFGGSSITGGVSFGHRDAFVGLSLDDGATWKKVNLSRSADLSSFYLANGEPYPGDVHASVIAVAGDWVLAGWLSKYCDGGTPAYTMEDDLGEPLYPDLFGVAGSQGSVDYTLQGFPEVGEIPYSCVWTARGTLELDEETQTYGIVWRKAERLTSGRRDANRLEIAGATGAGFVMMWQEDPEGLRPGQGLGPGEGWSGAIVNQKTDIWYSQVSWADFDWVLDADGNPVPLELYEGEEMPKVATPFAMPLRMSDNNMCKFGLDPENPGYLAYCYEDFDQDGTPDLCAGEVQWDNPGGAQLNLCKTQDGRVLWGRNGASRPRLTLEPYIRADGTTSAWLVVAYEELKAMGEGDDDLEDPIDIGKNAWYHTFDMFAPDIASQGAMLDQPAICNPFDAGQGLCNEGDFYPILVDEWGNEFYETEIARRFNLMTQSADKAGPSGTVGILIYKQGIINQGGPADIFLRRLVLPQDFNPSTDNPYDFENMACAEWAYADGLNPNYVKGLCLDPGINVSGNNIMVCDNGSGGEDCAAAFPWEGGDSYPKVTEWQQTEDNFDDQSWENPYDVAKGHRGFIDGDFVMMMYAWSPNWKANTVGNDHYNLYVRRSFDGGLTWTTTPKTLGGDGTETCENYGHGNDTYEVCTVYTAGAFEQARNVSQLVGNKVTVLDPRYTPTPGTILTDGSPLYDDDLREPSRFFIVYETGDNTTVAEGEAVPLDLFYSRAYDWGDDYDYVEYLGDDGELILAWDWLENQKDDLSGEAAVVSNPGGTFFYSAWNQWQEPEHDVIEQSDAMFRRIMYLDLEDAPPSAGIAYFRPRAAGHNIGGDATFVGTARDYDHLGEGIIAYEWSSDIDGLLGTDQILIRPVSQLSVGWHTLTFSAWDGEGNVASSSMGYLVAEQLYGTYLPIITR